MQFQGGPEYIQPEYEDILMKKILQAHAPEDFQVDASLLLDLTENIVINITMSSVLTAGAKSHKEVVQDNSRTKQNAKILDTLKEAAIAVHHISCEMLQHDSTGRPADATITTVLESLGKHQWSTKLAIVLAALASSYGNYWLIAQFGLTDPLALSLAEIKGLRDPIKLTATLSHRLKALMHLFEKMVGVAKCVMEFEILPLQYKSLDYEAMAMMKTQVCKASYWVIRSSVECASQITSIIASGFEQTNVTPAAWELWSLARKISSIYDGLRKKFDDFSQQIEKKVHLRLLNLFEEDHVDNHDVLYTLFALKDDFPLMDSCSQKKVGVDVLRNKVVLLFISSLYINPEKLLLIIPQLQNKSHTSEETCEIVWVPVIFSTEVAKEPYNQVLDIMPWYSIAEPSKVSLSVKKFIQEVWHFHGDPMMVALDSHGKVSSLDAFDIVAIWGSKGYPFTIARERELWEEESWTIKLLLGNIDPLISYWMEERKNIWLYGGNDLGWIQELSKRMKDIKEAGFLVELIYVGSKVPEQTRNTLTRIMGEKLSRYLSHVNISIFWLRLEIMRSSRVRLGYASESDFIIQEINSLLTFDTTGRGWLLVSEGTTTEVVKLLGDDQVLESLSLFQLHGQRVRKLGFLGALRKYLDASSTIKSCGHSIITPYSDSLNGGVVICKKCKSIMEKHIMYQCGTC